MRRGVLASCDSGDSHLAISHSAIRSRVVISDSPFDSVIDSAKWNRESLNQECNREITQSQNRIAESRITNR
jgi:hypothetical protein